MKHLFKTTLASAAIALWSGASFAADTVLTISSWAPPTHGINADMWPNLIKMMEEATDGRVSGEVKYGLGSPPAQFDLILDGAADLTWDLPRLYPGPFRSDQDDRTAGL